jgi:hypothetical protein
MTADDLTAPIEALRRNLFALEIAGRLAEHVLAAAEHVAATAVQRTLASGDSDKRILAIVAPLLQDFIAIAERLAFPLSDETEEIVWQAKAAGITLHESRPRKPSRPLSAAPKGPGGFSVFVDESGTASFDENSQPVLCLVGILVEDKTVPLFESAAATLLEDHGLPKELEFHAKEFLTANQDGPLMHLTADERYMLLRKFLALGMDHARGVHYLSMIKSRIKPEYRRKMLAQGLNAYSHTVVWFLLTLDRACILATPQGYRYFYDRTDAYRKDIGRILRALESTPNQLLRLFFFKSPAVMLESHQSRLIQLADVAGYFLSRYRQFEVRTFRHRAELDKHVDRIHEMYELIQPRVLDYIGKDLYRTVDWKALDDFSLKPSTPWRPPVGKRRR